jgi:DNA-binding transcriptional LysR family regulator
MELRHLRAFITLAEDLHFGRAAERLGIAQPALSLQIQSLEAMLGSRLFERSRRHVALSDIGRLFLPEARTTVAHADRALRTVQKAARGELGRLEVGFTGSAPYNTTMPSIIGRFHRRWPELSLSLREMSTAEQFAALIDGTLDIGFVRPGEPHEIAGLAVETLLHEPLFAVLAASHPLAARDSLAVAELAGQPFILHPRRVGTGLYDKVIDLCAAAGFAPQIVLEAHQMSTIVGLAATGIGISMVPEAMRRVQVDGVRFVPLTDRGASMVFAVAYRPGDTRPAVIHFLAEANASKAA